MDVADLFADLPDEAPDRRGITERATAGFKGGFGEAPLGLSPENLQRYPQLAVVNPLLAGGDAALRSIPALTGGAAGALAGLAENNQWTSKAEADRLQRDLTILGTGALIEPGMGAAAMRVPAAARAAPEALPDVPAASPPPREPLALSPPARVPALRDPERVPAAMERAVPKPEDAFVDVPWEEVATPTGLPPIRLGPPPPTGPKEDWFARAAAAREARQAAEPAPLLDLGKGEPVSVKVIETPTTPKEDWFARATAAREAREAADAAREAAKPPAKQPAIDFGKAPVEKGKPQTMAQFIAAEGGLELTGDAKAAGFGKWFVPKAGWVAHKKGKSIDGFWRERLMENGYLPRDPDGGFARDVRDEIYEKLMAESAGKPSYSIFDRDRIPKAKPDEKAASIESSAASIREAAEAAGMGDIEAGPLYDAAQMLLRGDETDALVALQRARQPARDIEAALAAERAALDARIGTEDIPFKRGGFVPSWPGKVGTGRNAQTKRT